MISTTTLFSIGIASMLGGSVIIETVFSCLLYTSR